MNKSPSKLAQWFDSDFYSTGAFITSVDGDIVTFGKGGTFSYVSHFKENPRPVFYLKDFYQNSYLAYTPGTILECTRSELEEYLETIKTSKIKSIGPINDDEIYRKDFENLQKSFGKDLEKVVLVSREYCGAFEGEDTIKTLFKKAFEFGTGIPYGLWKNDYGVVGSTPEPLYEADFDELRTMALAGTAPIGSEKELINSKKDQHEHKLVIKDISEKLKPFVLDLTIHDTEIHPYKNIVHLKTEIEAEIDETIDFTELTNALSPTAALGGYPKENSLEFLKHTDYSKKYPERFFGSCFGLISEDTKEFVVSIRNVQWTDKTLYVESGGGVVPDSIFDNELKEVQLKRETIKNHYL